MTEEQRIKHNEAVKAYKARNKDKIREQKRDYRERNKEAVNAQNREYRVEYRAENHDHLKQKNKEWRDNNPELYMAQKRRSAEKPENREAARLRAKAYREAAKAAKLSANTEPSVNQETKL